MKKTEAAPPLQASVTSIQVSDVLKKKLAKLGLHSSADLIVHLPSRYEDETVVTPIALAPMDEPVQVEAEVVTSEVQYRPRRQLIVRAKDESGVLVLRFFNFYPNQRAMLAPGARLRFFGEVHTGFFGAEMVHPRFSKVDVPLPQALTPVYPTVAGVSQKVLRKLISQALSCVDLNETVPPALLNSKDLPTFAEAVKVLHFPAPGISTSDLMSRCHPAWQRIKFEELLAQQLSLRRAYQARRQLGASALACKGELAQRLLAALPFRMTNAQRRVLAEIEADMALPYPMQRLLQGDVGSGKTIVAALAACHAIEAGWQAALMAPTEILAQQHYQKLKEWLEPFGVRVAWLAGSLKTNEKKTQQAEAAAGAQLLVGTHALIQDKVDFARLGLAIVDEQHRFGVGQRLALKQKGGNPHQLMMSATPIPRTLAMSYYADLDVSVLDELPPGRTPVRTRLISAARRNEVIGFLQRQAGLGRQAYWVCPLIEESEVLQLQTAIDTFAQLSIELPECRIGLVHGRLKNEEKQATMRAFVMGEIDILVATTVIEVGVDVPNASLMVIEHAERFGLSQLHQLRGRVGRGVEHSDCVLLYAEPLSQLARQRLKIIFENTDGFEVARQDLQLRGPGEFIGSRQSGLPMLRYADLEADVDLIELAKQVAQKMLEDQSSYIEAHLARWLGAREVLLQS